MLTFLSRSIGRWLGKPAAPRLRLLSGSGSGSALLSVPPRARLRVAEECDSCVALSVGATAFVAGQGARIYSLDAFRPRDPRNPRAA